MSVTVCQQAYLDVLDDLEFLISNTKYSHIIIAWD